jgi:hypothetical protein
MRKLFAGVTLLFLILGASASLEAAECQAAALLSPAAVSTRMEQPEVAESLEFDVLGSAVEMARPAPNCAYWACELGPMMECSCGGFFCNGRFICGTPAHF